MHAVVLDLPEREVVQRRQHEDAGQHHVRPTVRTRLPWHASWPSTKSVEIIVPAMTLNSTCSHALVDAQARYTAPANIAVSSSTAP